MTRSKSEIVLVGADTLLGHEIKEVLESAGAGTLVGFAANGEANFGEEEGEAVYREALSEASLAKAFAVISAGGLAGAEKALQLARSHAPRIPLIDCTGQLDHEPEARISGIDDGLAGPFVVVAHPAAMALAMLVSRLAAGHSMARAVVEVFEPASERGRAGLTELQQQTTGLLSFRPLDKAVYDTQVSFNMVPAYGRESQFQLESIEARIETHLATLLARKGVKAPMPSMRLVQAPVFHGYSFSGWFEFENAPQVAALVEALKEEGDIDVRTAEHEMPTNAGIAGQKGLAVGDIRIDRNNSKAVWIWAVADNLRMVADAVSNLVEELEAK